MKLFNYIYYFIILLAFTWSSESGIALVTKSKGNVEYKQKISKQFLKDIYVSKSLHDEDLIRTGRNGFTKFVYVDDGSAIKIHNNSEVYVQGDQKKRSIVKQININSGTLKLIVAKQAQNEFLITTPNSVASVKGTAFWVICDGNKGDQFIGLSGSVEVKNKETGQIVVLKKDTTVESMPDGRLDVKKTKKESILKLNKMEEDVGESPQDYQEIETGLNEDSDNKESINNSNSINELRIGFTNENGEFKDLIINFKSN